MIKVVLIGSGNVAQHLIQVLLHAKNVDLVQAFARTSSQLSHLLPATKITSDYQNYLEQEWLKELTMKYPFKINEKIIYSLDSN